MTPSTSPKWPRITLIALQVLQILSLAPWLMMAGLSFMVFDSPGSEKHWGPWAFVCAVWSYPIWLLLGGIASWLLLGKFHRRIAAVVLAGALALPALLLLLWLVFLGSLQAFHA